MEYKLKITRSYLWIPIRLHEKKEMIDLSCENQKILEFKIPIMSGGEPDYYASINVEHLLEKTLTIDGNINDHFLNNIRNEEYNPSNKEEDRPEIHFTADKGWINDPNGLVYHNGLYHMYFQYNPFDTEWDNMCWGHAISTDLLHWVQQDTVIWPDEYGMMFSGCGINNDRGQLGLDKEAIVFYYSAAGDSTPWSKGKSFTQGLAYSVDGGRHLIKHNTIRVDTIEKENRDPKVFWHEQSKAYIMVLWLREDEFAILRSEDMEHYHISQRLRLEKAFECPDLFQLRVDGKEDDLRWVFWCADGFYYIGEFDGFTFTDVSGRKIAYGNELPYAAQTVSGIENRTLSIPWLRAKFDNKCYTGAMGIPRELGLLNTSEGLLLQHKICREYESRRRLMYSVDTKDNDKEQTLTIHTECICNKRKPLEIEFILSEGGEDKFTIQLGSADLVIDPGENIIWFMEQEIRIPYRFSLDNLNLIIDHGIVELTAKHGIIYLVFELPNYESSDQYFINYFEKNNIRKINIFELETRN
jgi:sucrose-6-phosphate hydrolase SacC (GH32 family)